MGQYRARHLLLVPSLLSFLRLPLGLAFALSVDQPFVALSVLFVSGVSDVLDGWYARKHGQATPTGAVVDGVTDKTFAAIVVIALVSHGKLSWPEASILALREILELPLVIWWSLHRRQRKARAEDPKANRAGKNATVLEFATVAAALFEHRLFLPLLLVTGGVGVIAAISYWRRELAATRANSL